MSRNTAIVEDIMSNEIRQRKKDKQSDFTLM